MTAAVIAVAHRYLLWYDAFAIRPMPRPARTAAIRAPQRASGGRQREDKYFSKVIGKALDIIDILRSSAQPLSLNELTLRLELAKSSIFRILHTLEVSSYIERDCDAIAAISISSPKMRIRDEQLQKRQVAAIRRAAESVASQCVKRS